MRDEAAADAELAAVSDPASPRRGKFLTDDEYRAKYAPSQEDVGRSHAPRANGTKAIEEARAEYRRHRPASQRPAGRSS